MNDSPHKEKPQKLAATEATRFDESHNSTSRISTQQEVIRDSQSITLRATSTDEDEDVSKKKDRPEQLTQRLSRAETVRQDARKLKTATLNRMGKMFKQRSQTPVTDKSPHVNSDTNPIKSIECSSEETSKKEKSNSLGRMLKLVDKDGTSKKIFHPRAGSLSRILRRNPNHENNEDKKPEENSPGIFSRMLSQLRGRPHSGNATLEPNLKMRNKNSLPPKAPLNTRTTNNVPSSTSASSPQTQAAGSPQKYSTFEYSI
ncbi:uncharacterized protein LOC100576410 [Apis mellifera]|uniref:Uncharacterized protein LOC100576410 n=1 Tax=Apis mellifera TaxID=7460 RepID=A0A7M7IN51_APIME|nr:uncharacterized protein LOC100576410 [Apis mellifera]|eukprot:XP_016772443.2 uncharacterized protein LOC100576410 [Apis mellifera]